jgi:colanic acid/amylovoran biosynthesis protein
VAVTGDDALELIGGSGPAVGGALGVNVRVRGYAGVAASTAGAVGDVVLAAAAALGAPVTGLPVSRSGADGDLDALRTLLRRGPGQAVLDDLASPGDLASAAAGCRAIVTGSYHAAVFGLAQGVPAVCLTRSPYYDAKFGGLAALFPGACLVMPLDTPGWPDRLRAAISAAWHLPAPARVAAWEAAARLRDAGRDAYARFRAEAEAGAGREQHLHLGAR